MDRKYLAVWAYEERDGRITLHWREEAFTRWLRMPGKGHGLKRGKTSVSAKQTLFSCEVDGILSAETLREAAKCHLDGDCELVSVSLQWKNEGD